jgi:hypothetical protein
MKYIRFKNNIVNKIYSFEKQFHFYFTFETFVLQMNDENEHPNVQGQAKLDDDIPLCMESKLYYEVMLKKF